MQVLLNNAPKSLNEPMEDVTIELFEMHLHGNLFSPGEAAQRKLDLLKTMVRTGIAARRPTFFDSMYLEAERLVEQAGDPSLGQELCQIAKEHRIPSSAIQRCGDLTSADFASERKDVEPVMDHDEPGVHPPSLRSYQ